MCNVLLLFGLFSGCKFDSGSVINDKDSTSFDKIRKSLIKEKIYSYLSADTLLIFDENNIEITRVKLPSYGSLKDFYLKLDTNYTIEQKKSDNRLLITIGMPRSESDPSNFVLVDLRTKKVILNLTADFSDSYYGTSADGKYHIIESGTSACGRGFTIFDSNGNIVKNGGYYSCINDNGQLTWLGNKFYYYNDCDKSFSLPKDLPSLKEQEVYVQKYYWSNGKDSIVNEFSVAGVE